MEKHGKLLEKHAEIICKGGVSGTDIRGSKRKEILNKCYNTVLGFGQGKDRFPEIALKQFIQQFISYNIIIECLTHSNETVTTPYSESRQKEYIIESRELLVYK